MKSAFKGMMLALMMGAMSACSGGGGGESSDSTSGLTLSGSLATSFTKNNASTEENRNLSVGILSNGALSISPNDLQIYVIAFSNPPVIAQADVNSDGSFSVTLPGVSEAPITAIFRNKTSLATVGQIVFQDPAVKDINGNVKDLSTVSLSKNASLGSITLGDDGKITIPVTQIAEANNTSTSSGFDFNGTYTSAAFPGVDHSKGFLTAGDQDALPVGRSISLIRLVGKEFTPNSGCVDASTCAQTDGTVGTADRFGISIWEGAATDAISSCGYKVGFTQPDARYHAHIDIPTAPTIDTHALSFGAFTFTGINNGGAENSQDSQLWMKSGATATHDYSDCSMIAMTASGVTTPYSVCKGTGTIYTNGSHVDNQTIYMVGAQGGGCIEDSTGAPVKVNNWAAILPDSNSCSRSTTGNAGIYNDSCHYTNKAPDSEHTPQLKTFTCTFKGGTFTTFDGTMVSNPLLQTQFVNNVVMTTLIANGAICSIPYASSEAKKLAVYRCYAQAYDQSGGSGSGCAREYHFNWGTTNSSNFVMTDGHNKPKANFITDIVTYSADGNTFFVDNFENETIAIAGMNGAMNFCDIEHNNKLTGRKITDNQILFNLIQKGRLKSLTAGCVAAANGADTWENGNLSHRIKEQKMIFYLNK